MRKLLIMFFMLGICLQNLAQMNERFKTINLCPYEGSWEYYSANAPNTYFRIDIKRIKAISRDLKSYTYQLWGNYSYRDEIRQESHLERIPSMEDIFSSDLVNSDFSANRIYPKFPEWRIDFDSTYVELLFQDQLYKKQGEGRITWINDSTLHWQLEEPRDIVLLEEGSHDGPGFSVPTNVILRRRKKITSLFVEKNDGSRSFRRTELPPNREGTKIPYVDVTTPKSEYLVRYIGGSYIFVDDNS